MIYSELKNAAVAKHKKIILRHQRQAIEKMVNLARKPRKNGKLGEIY